MFIRTFFVFLAVACAFPNPVQAVQQIGDPDPNDPVRVGAPCAFTEEAAQKGPQAGLRTCRAFFSGEDGRPGFLANLKKLMIAHIEKTLATPTNTGLQACVLVANPLVLKNGAPFPEDRFNRAGASCGNRMRVRIQTSPDVVVQFFKEPPATGTLEDGWIAGAQFQAMAFYHQEVSGQIAGTRQFVARNYNANDTTGRTKSYAADMARDYNDLFASRNTLYEIISARTDTKALLAAIADCKKAEDGSETGLTFTVGQQVAQLCSAQLSLERAYLNIATVEIMGRAESSFYEKFGGDVAYLRMIDRIQQDMKNFCWSAGQNGADRCYNDNIAAKMRDYIQTAWPGVSLTATAQAGTWGSTQASLESSTPWFLMAAALRRRKKKARRTARPQSAPNALRRLLRALTKIAGVALMGAWFAGGCGGATAANTPTQLITGNRPGGQGGCPWGAAVGTYKMECCAPDGTLCATEGQAGCNVVCKDIFTIADGPIKASIITGADDMGATRTSLDNAAVLLGVPLNAINASGGGPDGSVRSAALSGAKLGAGNQNPDGETPGSGNTNNTIGKTGGGGDGVGPGSQSGSTPGSIFGNNGGGSSLALNGGAHGGSKDAASAGVDGKGGKGQTYGGAGGKHGEGGPMDGAGLFGELAGGERAPAGLDLAFGKAVDGTNPMGSSDPDDYFTRTGLDESIFRIVSRRYRAKAFTWATVQSQASFQEAARASTKK